MKAQRREVAASVEGAQEGMGGERAAPPSLEQIREAGDRGQRLERLVRYLTGTPLDRPEDASLRLVHDLGLSSLDLVELVTSLENQLQIPINDNIISERVTLADFKHTIQEQKSRRVVKRLPKLEPGWSRTVIGDLLRSFVQPVVIGLWATLSINLVSVFPKNEPVIQKPLIIAAAPHRHWLDPLTIYATLPRHLRKKILIVTNRDFRTFFSPSPGTRMYKRLLMGLAYYILIPMVFRFTILPKYGTTRVGLYETGRLMERGYTPIMFPKGFFFHPEDSMRHDPGASIMAFQTQALILPVWIEGNDSASFRDLKPKRREHRPTVQVRYGKSILAAQNPDVGELVDELEAAYNRLSRTE
jgi:acyl carrier protein/1-acyl-sn-glycerol-3-phosphate acyltransferase